MAPTRPRRIFVLLSIVLLASDLLLIATTTRAADATLQRGFDAEGEHQRAAFQLTLDDQLSAMVQMATLLSHDTVLQRRFHEGVQAVRAEGGGPGGAAATAARARLYDTIGPTWQHMTHTFDVRQLHFHIGPGSLSFLRVHQPDKFGDRMDDLRHIIVDSYAERAVLRGFETGRIYSGLRGVVPMHAPDPETGEPLHIGTLEVGSAFDPVLQTVDRKLGVGAAVLLETEHVEDAMWGEFVERQFQDDLERCNCKVEATSRPVRAVLEAAQPPPLDLTGQGSRLIEHDGRATLLTRFPLFDYAASRRGTAAPVGTVLLWRDATQEVQAHQRTKRQAMLFALFGFVLVESLLWAGVRFVTERLESEVEQRTQEVQALNVQLQAQAVTDELTGLPNRRELMRELRVQVTRAHRSGAPLSLLMFDIDHFKRVNDTHGHQAGDAVLVRVAEVVEEVRRAADRPGRYGGEEFCLVLPDTDTAGATALAERLRAAIEATPFAPASTRRLSVTVSVGVARLTPEMRARELIKAADRALYAAKAGGRNRVVLAEGVQA